METILEKTAIVDLNLKDKIGYWINKKIMGGGYTQEDYRWGQLHNLIVKYHKDGKQIPDQINLEYTKLTIKRSEGRPNQTPL